MTLKINQLTMTYVAAYHITSFPIPTNIKKEIKNIFFIIIIIQLLFLISFMTTVKFGIILLLFCTVVTFLLLQYLYQWHFCFCDITATIFLRVSDLQGWELFNKQSFESFKVLNDTWTQRFFVGYILKEGIYYRLRNKDKIIYFYKMDSIMINLYCTWTKIKYSEILHNSLNIT